MELEDLTRIRGHGTRGKGGSAKKRERGEGRPTAAAFSSSHLLNVSETNSLKGKEKRRLIAKSEPESINLADIPRLGLY